MIQLILKFLQAVVGKCQKEFYAFVDRLRIANLVRLYRREIVLLLQRPPAHERRRAEEEGSQEKKMYFEFHGSFSPGGVAPCGSTGRRGKSIFRSSSSKPTRSRRTI